MKTCKSQSIWKLITKSIQNLYCIEMLRSWEKRNISLNINNVNTVVKDVRSNGIGVAKGSIDCKEEIDW